MPDGVAPASAKYLAEFLGTYILVLTVGCNVLSDNKVWGATSIACVLMVLVYSLGAVSGANFNPAVTSALLCSRCINAVDACGYIVVQLIGGLGGGATAKLIFKHSIHLAPAHGFTWIEAGVVEVLYTCMLCFVVLNVACSKVSAAPNQFYGLAIGFVIIAAGYGPGAVSLGAFNPAVAVGIDIPSWNQDLGYGWCFYYMGFEMIGAVLASLLHRIVRPGEYGAGSGEATMANALMSEVLGTFFLVLTVGFNVLSKSPAAAWSIAAALMCMVYALGGVSGAHYNPAVTFAVLLSGRGKSGGAGYAAMYMAAQIAGAVVAGIVYSMTLKDSFPIGPKGGYPWFSALAAELVFTFVLTFVVLCVATSMNFQREMFGLAIGACVTVGGVAIGDISGGVLNPAASIGIEAAHALKGGGLGNSLIYAAVQFAGGALAAAVFRVTNSDEFVKGWQGRYLPLVKNKSWCGSGHAVDYGCCSAE